LLREHKCTYLLTYLLTCSDITCSDITCSGITCSDIVQCVTWRCQCTFTWRWLWNITSTSPNSTPCTLSLWTTSAHGSLLNHTTSLSSRYHVIQSIDLTEHRVNLYINCKTTLCIINKKYNILQYIKLVMWRLSSSRSFSKIEWNRYRNFLDRVCINGIVLERL